MPFFQQFLQRCLLQLFLPFWRQVLCLLVGALSATFSIFLALPLVSLAAFLGGAAIGGVLQRRFGERRPHHLTIPLGCEALLTAAALIYAVLVSAHPGTISAGVLIAVLAGAMGVRNAAVRSLGVPDLIGGRLCDES